MNPVVRIFCALNRARRSVSRFFARIDGAIWYRRRLGYRWAEAWARAGEWV